MSNVKGFGDYGKTNKGGDDKKKKESYIGGEKSGLAVEDADDDLEKIVKNGEARVDTCVNRSETSGERGPANPPGPGGEKTKVKVTLYKNGFVINDNHEDFRMYDTPENKKFIQDLSEGYVPQEIIRQHPRGVDCGLEDKR